MNDHEKRHPPPDYGHGPGSHHGGHPGGHPGHPGDHHNGGGSVHGSHMYPPAPPSHHTSVTMTTGTQPGVSVTEINLDIAHYKTIPGILKLVQLVSCCYNLAIGAVRIFVH